MIDHDDVHDWFWFSNPTGWVGLVIVLAVGLALNYVADRNDEDCAAKHCSAGMAPKLMVNDCLCVERAE